jgi:hypothetical protein
VQIYPTVPHARIATIIRDAAVVAAVLLFIVLGVKVHDAVDHLAVLGSGVADAGGAVRSGFRDAGEAVGEVPVVGGSLRDGLESAGSGTGGPIEDAGRQGEESAHDLANLLGALTALIPSLLLLGYTLPPRIAQIQALTAAARVLRDPADPERRELIARRAAFGLPYGTLVRYSRDPLGDLQSGRLEPLITAALEDAGLMPGASRRSQ